MKNYIKKSIFIFCGLFLIIPIIAKADGMIIPPPNYYIHETDQKAVIFYDKGVESLILSITFKGNADDFGWVVPVPSKPEVSKGSDDIFSNLETLTGTTSRYYDEMPIFGLGSSGTPEKVTIIETKKIDYYNVTVLTSTESNALTDWLQDNNYSFPASASYILESYIQNNWYFVAMKINPQSLEWKDVSQQLREGHATPVVLKFKTDNIVYPLKISSVVSQVTEDTEMPEIDIPYTDETIYSPTYVEGRIEKGISFASNDVYTFSADNAFSADEGTIEMWVKPGSDWSSSSSVYWTLFSVVDNQGRDVFEFKRMKNDTHDNLQFTTYNPPNTKANTKAGLEQLDQDWEIVGFSTCNTTNKLIWNYDQWYHIAVTWLKSESPQIYINGVAQTLDHCTVDMSSVAGGKIYIGQLGEELWTNSVRAAVDEVRITSKQKTADEVKTAYNQVLNNKQLELENNTSFLSHFNSNLKDEKSGKEIDYENIRDTDSSTNNEGINGYNPPMLSILSVEYTDENGIAHTLSTDPIADATIATAYDNNYGKMDLCDVGRSGNSNTHACLVKFDLSLIPKTATIKSASLKMYAQDSATGLTVNVYKLLRDWKEGTSPAGSGERNSPEIDGVTANERYYGAKWSEQFVGTNDVDATSKSYGSLILNGDVGYQTWNLDTELMSEWISGNSQNYGIILKATSGSGVVVFHSREPNGMSRHYGISKKVTSYTQPTSASILLYVIADNKKELTNFSTNYANWIDKKSIQKLAVDDQGNPLIKPSGKKYFLTKLTRTMKYSDMTADLFLQDAANNETVGKPISGGTDSRLSFFILIAMAVAITIFLVIIIIITNQQRSNGNKNNKLIIK